MSGVRNENNRVAYQVIIDIGGGHQRYYLHHRLDIDYESQIIEISEAEEPHKLVATAPLSKSLILWEDPGV